MSKCSHCGSPTQQQIPAICATCQSALCRSCVQCPSCSANEIGEAVEDEHREELETARKEREVSLGWRMSLEPGVAHVKKLLKRLDNINPPGREEGSRMSARDWLKRMKEKAHHG